jgi:hypothetical protein
MLSVTKSHKTGKTKSHKTGKWPINHLQGYIKPSEHITVCALGSA